MVFKRASDSCWPKYSCLSLLGTCSQAGGRGSGPQSQWYRQWTGLYCWQETKAVWLTSRSTWALHSYTHLWPQALGNIWKNENMYTLRVEPFYIKRSQLKNLGISLGWFLGTSWVMCSRHAMSVAFLCFTLFWTFYTFEKNLCILLLQLTNATTNLEFFNFNFKFFKCVYFFSHFFIH